MPPSLPPPSPGLRACVVVPARDEQDRVGACVAALAAQTGVARDAYEVLLVLDGCTDATGAVAERAAATASMGGRWLTLHLLDGPREGVGRARGLGMSVAATRLRAAGAGARGLIASTDADSTAAPDWLATLVAATATAGAPPAATATATAPPAATVTTGAPPAATATTGAPPAATATATATAGAPPAATATATAGAPPAATPTAGAPPAATATATAGAPPAATPTAGAPPAATPNAGATPAATATAGAPPAATPARGDDAPEPADDTTSAPGDGRAAAAVGGRITLDPAEAAALEPAVLARREAEAARRLTRVREHTPAAEHHQFSGANLALTVAAYDAVGGLPDVAALEDEALERALLAAGLPLAYLAAARVQTSARTESHVPRGLAQVLRTSAWAAAQAPPASRPPPATPAPAASPQAAAGVPAGTPDQNAGSTPADAARRAAASGVSAETPDGARPAARAGAAAADVSTATPDSAAAADVSTATPDSAPAAASAAGADVSAETPSSALPAALAGAAAADVSTATPDSAPAAASAAGAGVSAETPDDVLVVTAGSGGRGRAIHRALAAAVGVEVVVVLEDGAVAGDAAPLVAALRADAGIVLARPAGAGARSALCELVGRPLLNLYAPDLAVVADPLARTWAIRARALRALALPASDAVDLTVLVDVWLRHGLQAITEVPTAAVATRQDESGVAAYELLVAVQRRCPDAPLSSAYATPDATSRALLDELPPLAP